MSLIKIRAALETALDAMTPALSTAWENVDFIPVTDVAYQQAFLVPSEPDNLEVGPVFMQGGIFQINLRYPLKNGPAGAQARAELIRTTFKRGSSFSNSGVVVNIIKTPAIGTGATVEGRWFLPVRIYFNAQLIG